MRQTQHESTEKRVKIALGKIFKDAEIMNVHISRDRFFNAFIRDNKVTYELKYARAEHVEFRKRNTSGRPLYSVWASVYLDHDLITESPVFVSCVDIEEDHKLFPNPSDEGYTEEGCYSGVIDDAFLQARAGAIENINKLGLVIQESTRTLSGE